MGAWSTAANINSKCSRIITEFAIDIDPIATTAHSIVHPHTPTLTADICKLTTQLTTYTAQLITASIPCQPFSFAGLDLDNRDTRDLSSSISDLIHNIFPPILIIENVHRFLKSNAFTILRTNATQHGYKVLATSVDILRWVPLSRARCAVFFIREDISQECNWFNKHDPFIYPSSTSPKPTIANSPSISREPHPEDIISDEEICAYSIYVRNRSWPSQ
jgi:site-specific DNA-cytosine methylase